MRVSDEISRDIERRQAEVHGNATYDDFKRTLARSRRLAHPAGRRRKRIRTISGAGELAATLRLSHARARLQSRPGDEFLATLRS
jgi:hypothetical protein